MDKKTMEFVNGLLDALFGESGESGTKNGSKGPAIVVYTNEKDGVCFCKIKEKWLPFAPKDAKAVVEKGDKWDPEVGVCVALNKACDNMDSVYKLADYGSEIFGLKPESSFRKAVLWAGRELRKSLGEAGYEVKVVEISKNGPGSKKLSK